MPDLMINPSDTPNPNARKFTLNLPVGETMLNLGSADEAAAYPLATDLFALTGVTNIFLTADFITVNKSTDRSWESLEPDILAIIRNYYT